MTDLEKAMETVYQLRVLIKAQKINLQQAINYLKAGRYETALEILEDVERTL